MNPRTWLLDQALRRASPASKMMMVSLRSMDDALACYPLKSSLTGKTVVDVGCDWGNTPLYWRLNGAAKVIGFETVVKPWMRPLRSEPWFDFRGGWDGSYPEGDLFKIDCEGCEKRLGLEKLDDYPSWFVALHNPHPPYLVDTRDMGKALESLGGKLVHRQEFNGKEELVYGRMP